MRYLSLVFDVQFPRQKSDGRVYNMDELVFTIKREHSALKFTYYIAELRRHKFLPTFPCLT